MFTRRHGSVLVNYVPLKKEPEFATTDGGGGDGGDTGDACIDTDGCYDYGSPEDDPESKVIDVYYHPVKEEPETELGDGKGDAVVVNGCCNCDPPKEEPELVSAGADSDDDDGPDVGYDCSHCGISLGTRKFKVEHESRCKVRMQRREFESKITKLYHCGYCRCPFVNGELKEQHQRRGCPKRPVGKRRDSKGPYFGCDKCEYVAKQKKNLETHLLTHDKNNAEWFTCTQCSFKTVRKYSINRHTKIHSNAFSCCCPICGKSFRGKQHLDDHLVRQHADKSDEVSKLITSKVYTCDICDRFRTTRKTEFNEHLAIKHLKGVGRRKYECPRCPYSTFRKADLNKHSKTHTEEKDYRCSVCQRQFTQKTLLDSHVLCKHADNVDLVKTITSKIHSCESCSFKTVNLTHLKKHVRLKHT